MPDPRLAARALSAEFCGTMPLDGRETGVEALREKLAAIRAEQPYLEPDIVAKIVSAVLTTIGHDLSTKEATLLKEVGELSNTIAIAKAEIAALRVNDIKGHDIPSATDELDAIVDHTEQATNSILESCELLDEVAASVSGDIAVKLLAATARIYESCSFQDITGQRISKVVTTLKTIEDKASQIVRTFGQQEKAVSQDAETCSTPEAALLNGPQLPAQAMDQSDIDKLLASFE